MSRLGAGRCAKAEWRLSDLALGDRPLRIGDPLAPRAGVEPRERIAGDRHREQVVAGADAGAAIVDEVVGRRARAASPRTPRAARARERNVPSAAMLRVYGRLSAPGMWPATGSSGSTSPR